MLKEAFEAGWESKGFTSGLAHKARSPSQQTSFEEAAACLQPYAPARGRAHGGLLSGDRIEKIHNLNLSTRLPKALELTLSMTKKCTARCNTRVRAWFERYLSVIHFYQGDYLKCLHYYEKSLSFSEEEQDWLSRHCAGAYAAKAYQVAGQEEKAVPLF